MATTSTSMPYTGIIIIALVLSSSGTNGDHDGSLKNDFSKESGGGGTSTKMKIAVMNCIWNTISHVVCQLFL